VGWIWFVDVVCKFIILLSNLKLISFDRSFFREPEYNLVNCEELIQEFEDSSLVLKFKYNRTRNEWIQAHKSLKYKRGRESDDSYEGSSDNDDYIDDDEYETNIQ
jgi:hypothetical protein